ncbi:MAG: hypothetical protein ACK504_02545 [Bacteroidota bacterium]
MKKLYILIILATLSLMDGFVFSQTTIMTEDFDGVVTPNFPSIVSVASGDWQTDPNTLNGGAVPVCNVAGSSSLNVLGAGDGSSGLEEITFGPINASAYSNLLVSWNGYRSTGAPSLNVFFSIDGTNFFPVSSFTNVPADDSWHALTSFSLPAVADGQATLYIKLSYTGTNSGAFMAFDDLKLVGTQSPLYYWNGSGNLDLLSSWGVNPDGSGANPTNFTAASQVFNIVNGTSATIGANWIVGGSLVKVIVGDGATWNPNFTVPSAFTFSINSGAVLTVSTGAILTLQNTTLPTTGGVTAVFQAGSTVNYAQSSSVNIIQSAHSNLTVSGGSSKTQAGNLTINGVLNLNGSNYIAPNSSLQTLTLNGSITGSGAIQTTSLTNITIGGVGAFGTLTCVSSPTTSPVFVRNLNINRSSSGTISLGNDLTVNNTFALINGQLNLNGKHLMLNANITFPAAAANGGFTGSSTSSLTIQGSGGYTNSLLMNQSSSSTKTLYDLTLSRPSQTLVIGNGLEILNSITPSAGTLNFNSNVTLKSTAALKARLGVVGGAVTGTLTVETFIPGGSAGWANLGPAGVNGLKVTNWDGGSGSATNFAMTCDGCIYGTDAAGGHFVSIQSDPTGTETFVELVSSDDLVPGTGYWTFVGADLASAIDVTQTNSGPAVSGTITSSGRFVSNPYASPISLDLLKTHNSGLTSIDIWNANTASYVSFNGGLPSTSTIPMGQAFYANGVSNIQFIETDKVSFNGAPYSLLKTSSSIGNVVELDINAPNGDQDKTYIRFHGNATTSFDKDLDAYKRYVTPGYLGIPGPTYDKYTTIATLNANQDYAINSLPFAITADAIIPVKVKVSQTGTYTIQPIGVDAAIATGACLTLRDKLLNVTHDLKKGAYVVEINDTTLVARFELKVCADITAGINNLNQSTLSSLLIAQDQTGAYVETNFATKTKATISAYNVIGQKLMDDQEFEGTQTKVHLNLGQVNSQVVIIKVTTANESSVKKLFIN